MKIILNQDVKGCGVQGDVIDVADGYGRNFLLKNRLAVIADVKNLKELKNKKKIDEKKKQLAKEEAIKFSKLIDGKTIVMNVNAGISGKLFGGVTSKDISIKLKDMFGVEIEKRMILLDNNIKSVGSYVVTVKFEYGIFAKIYVTIEG
jgi:large subunit ribosomal protein L9